VPQMRLLRRQALARHLHLPRPTTPLVNSVPDCSGSREAFVRSLSHSLRSVHPLAAANSRWQNQHPACRPSAYTMPTEYIFNNI
jgi:hypothetical protein